MCEAFDYNGQIRRPGFDELSLSTIGPLGSGV